MSFQIIEYQWQTDSSLVNQRDYWDYLQEHRWGAAHRNKTKALVTVPPQFRWRLPQSCIEGVPSSCLPLPPYISQYLSRSHTAGAECRWKLPRYRSWDLRQGSNQPSQHLRLGVNANWPLLGDFLQIIIASLLEDNGCYVWRMTDSHSFLNKCVLTNRPRDSSQG